MSSSILEQSRGLFRPVLGLLVVAVLGFQAYGWVGAVVGLAVVMGAGMALTYAADGGEHNGA